MKKQVILIRGGNSFASYEKYINFLKGLETSLDYYRKQSWKGSLQEKLGPEYDVVKLEMPSTMNAKFLEWKIIFDKLAPLFDEGAILVGHSLGGIFLAKYLAEYDMPRKVSATFLIAPPYRDANSDPDYDLGDFILPNDLSRLAKQGGQIILFHSREDPVVPFSALQEYSRRLPEARTRVFEGKGHFSISEFPELVEEIRGI